MVGGARSRTKPRTRGSPDSGHAPVRGVLARHGGLELRDHAHGGAAPPVPPRAAQARRTSAMKCSTAGRAWRGSR